MSRKSAKKTERTEKKYTPVAEPIGSDIQNREITPKPETGNSKQIPPNKWKFSPEVNAAIVGGIASLIVLIAGIVLINLGVVENISRNLRSKELEIKADAYYSGSGYRNSSAFNNFESGNAPITIGDDVFLVNEKMEDFQSKAIISFYVDDIPQNAEIEDATLIIPCRVVGDPSSFTELQMKSIGEGRYSPELFDSYTSDWWPSSGFHIFYKNTQVTLSFCKTEGVLAIGKNAKLRETLSDSVNKGSYLQFVLWFAATSISQNGLSDAIVLNELPSLQVKYIAP